MAGEGEEKRGEENERSSPLLLLQLMPQKINKTRTGGVVREDCVVSHATMLGGALLRLPYSPLYLFPREVKQVRGTRSRGYGGAAGR